MTRETVTRKCILTSEIKPVNDLLRFVVLNNELLPDFNKKLPAKGIYVTCNRSTLLDALNKKLFHKVSRHNLKIADNFIEVVENLLKQKAFESINLANKSGALISGFEKVREAIKKNKVDFIIEAKNAGTDGKEKVALLAKNIEIFNLFSIDELDKVLNKENTVHIAILKESGAKVVYNNLKKYKNFIE